MANPKRNRGQAVLFCKKCQKQMEKVDFWMYVGLYGFLILLIWLLIW